MNDYIKSLKQRSKKLKEELPAVKLEVEKKRQLCSRGMHDHIKSARKKLGLTQAEFASRIMVSVNTVRAWEQGKRNPGKHALEYIAEVLRKERFHDN